MSRKIRAVDAKNMMDRDNVIVVDVREREELSAGYIEGSVLVPLSTFKTEVKDKLPDKEAVYLIYCRSGRRSAICADIMEAMGYTHVYDFGGIIDWPFETIV